MLSKLISFFNLILLGYFRGGNVEILTVAIVLLFISLATFLSIVLHMYHIPLRIKPDISTDSLHNAIKKLSACKRSTTLTRRYITSDDQSLLNLT